MFISIETQLRVNPYAQFVDSEGTTYPRMPPHLYTEIPEPPPPEEFSEESYIKMELDAAPYVIYEKRSQEQLDEIAEKKIKLQIAIIEAGQSRAVREAGLGQPAFLQKIEADIQALRGKLKPKQNGQE